MCKISEQLMKEVEKINDSNQLWKKESPHIKIKHIDIDSRGQVGEQFLLNIFKMHGNYNTEDIGKGHESYDIKINEFKIEVKTATQGKTGTFQHEGLTYDEDWDMVAFLDITPDEIYFNLFKKDEFTFKNDEIYLKLKTQERPKKLHHRGKDNSGEKATGAGYKLDLTHNQAKIGLVKSPEEIIQKFEDKISGKS